MNHPAQFQNQDEQAVDAGFTLIELLVSMTIMALLMTLVATSVQVISDGWTRGGKAAGISDMVGRASDVLRRDLSAARRIVLVDKLKKPRFLFAGAADTMTFVVREPPYPTSPGLYIVRLSIAKSPNGLRLIRSRTPYRAEAAARLNFDNRPLSEAVDLMHGNFQVDLSYRDKTTSWQPNWPDRRRLPSHVRIRLRTPIGSRLVPDIIARFGATAEQGCVNQKVCTIKSNGQLPAKVGEPKKTPKPAPSASQATPNTSSNQ